MSAIGRILPTQQARGVLFSESESKVLIKDPEWLKKQLAHVQTEAKKLGVVKHILRTNLHPGYHVTAAQIWEKIKGEKKSYPSGVYKVKKTAKDQSGTVVARLVSHDQEVRTRNIYEYNLLKEFSGVKGIVQVYALMEGINKNGTWTLTIVEENFNHGDLSQFFEKLNTLRDDQLIRIIDPLIEGFAAVHQKGYVFRDLKHSNIVIREDGSGFTAAHCDFGLVKKVHFKTTKIHGALEIMPPEKNAQPETWYDADEFAADVWSFGLILYTIYKKTYPEWWYFETDEQVEELMDEYEDKEGSFFDEPSASHPILHLIWEMCQCRPERRPSAQIILEKWRAITTPEKLTLKEEDLSCTFHPEFY